MLATYYRDLFLKLFDRHAGLERDPDVKRNLAAAELVSVQIDHELTSAIMRSRSLISS